jgi:hypothetical protein
MRCAAVDELVRVLCIQETDDSFVVEDSGQDSLFLSVTEDEVERCVEIGINAAIELRDALSRWIGEQ